MATIANFEKRKPFNLSLTSHNLFFFQMHFSFLHEFQDFSHPDAFKNFSRALLQYNLHISWNNLCQFVYVPVQHFYEQHLSCAKPRNRKMSQRTYQVVVFCSKKGPDVDNVKSTSSQRCSTNVVLTSINQRYINGVLRTLNERRLIKVVSTLNQR